MKVGFLLYSSVHGNPDIASSRIRGNWLVKYWDEAEEFVYGRQYDAVVYQKVYRIEHAKLYKGIKIFDICDPDWCIREPVREMIELCDAVTVPTEALGEFIQSFTKIPVYVVKDRQDLEYLKEKKQHRGIAKEAVWYGYSHNAHVLKATLPHLARFNLGLSIISESMVTISAYGDDSEQKKVKERWTKWNAETVNREIIKSDMVIMPGSARPSDRFKSDNKTTNAWALRMPVAVSVEDLKRFSNPDEREKEAEKNLEKVKNEYDVKISVAEMKELINEIRAN